MTNRTANFIRRMELRMSPPCRICKSAERVICYPDDHSKTICPECCPAAEHDDGETGHQFKYYHGEGWTCDYCGVERGPENYDYSDD